MKLTIRLAAFLWLAGSIIGSARAADTINLIRDGSFEHPGVQVGTHQEYTLGENYGAWAVVGPSGANIDVISSAYTEAGFSVPARSGLTFVDLTGKMDNGLPQGVSQSVKTVPGTEYDLSFWVGNIYDPNGYFGVSSTINVYINNNQVFSATNKTGKGLSRIVWKRFAAEFVATTNKTNVSFINGDLAGSDDRIRGLDAVRLTPVVPSR